MNNIATANAAALAFSFNSHPVRVVIRNGEPWFVATDIAEVLGYRNAPDAARNLPDHQKGTHNMRTLGGDQKMTIISEGGMYRLVLRSRKPEAAAFTDWVTDEVLPSIRKTGSYAVPDSNPLVNPKLRDEIADIIRRETKFTLNETQVYRIWLLMNHFAHLYDIYKRNGLYQHLTGLGSHIGIEMHDHFLDGMNGICALEDEFGAWFEDACQKMGITRKRLTGPQSMFISRVAPISGQAAAFAKFAPST